MPESVPCPTCRQPAKWDGNPYRPFCSQRCKVKDLGAWAAETYRVPGESIEPGVDDDAAAESPSAPGRMKP